MKYRALIVDDNEADQFLTHYVISEYHENFQIDQVYDGQEALEYLQTTEGTPDIIFLDLNMPRMNGLEFLTKYQSLYKGNTAVIVMLTSSIRDQDKEDCLSFSEVKRFFSKPITPDYLDECISIIENTVPTHATLDKPDRTPPDPAIW